MPDLADPSTPVVPSGPAAPGTTHGAATLPGWIVAALAVALAAVSVARYPLAPGLLAALLLSYGAALWRWPVLWLAVVPAALPAFDLAPWTGWLPVDEADLFVLVTIAVLAVRAAPRRADFVLRGSGGAAVALAALALVVGVARGLALAGPPGGSDIPELRPDNALRIAKGFVIALALLPFLRRALRERGDALGWLAAGMAAGLALVAAAALWERAVFTGIFNLRQAYRIVATFSSMHLGGGYVGLYVAMALPFLFVPLPRRDAATRLATLAVAAGALYTLVVSFARAAYASAVVATAVLALGRMVAGRRRSLSGAALAAPVALLLVVGCITAAVSVDSRFMAYRLVLLRRDWATRLALWSDGLALRDGGAGTALLGMGLGTYARTARARAPAGGGAGNFVLEEENGRHYLALEAGLPIYVGQKVAIAPRQLYHLTFALRSPDGRGAITAILCEKLLLYSGTCRAVEARPDGAGTWQQVDAVLPSFGLARSGVLGLRRPVELAFFLPVPGSALEFGDVRFTDGAGRELVANGDFSHGLARWYFTDDDHWVWRIENQYLMTLFEGGALGVAALVLLAAAALGGAARAIGRGDALAPALAASLAAFLFSALFDCPLEVPRLAALFYLVAFAAIALGEDARPRA